MNRRIRGKINSGEVGALYDNERKNKTIIVNVSSGLGSFGGMQKDSKT